jgi:hypothetical protein
MFPFLRIGPVLISRRCGQHQTLSWLVWRLVMRGGINPFCKSPKEGFGLIVDSLISTPRPMLYTYCRHIGDTDVVNLMCKFILKSKHETNHQCI